MNASQTFLYNEECKKSFLNEMVEAQSISEDTSKNYERILSLVTKYEEALGKDVSQFTFEELEKIMFGFKANNRNTVETYSRIMSSYLNWSVSRGFATENCLADLKPDDFSKYLEDNEVYFTDKQVRRWEEQMNNYQDAVIIRLLFEGVGGKQMSEIRNLKKSDIDFNEKRMKLINTLKADDNGNPIKYTERYVDFDDYTAKVLEGAIKETTYKKRNGDMIYNPHVRDFTDLVDNEFVVRSSITKTENKHNPVDKFVIYRRIQMLSEVLGIEEFTAKLIQRSGMIYYASTIMQGEELSLDDLKMVADKFGVKSYHNLKGFLTAENILKTYPRYN